MSVRSIVRGAVQVPLHALFQLGEIYSRFVSLLKPGEYVWGDMCSQRIGRRQTTIQYRNLDTDVTLTFHAPNSLCERRAATFSSKEPETLDWIDRFGGSGALFDIGANVGTYTVYFAKSQPGNVYAFEPSVFNTSLLARNINANNVQAKVRLLMNPLSGTTGYADFKLQSISEGGALSAFGVDYGHDGQPIAPMLSYRTYGFSVDDMVAAGMLPELPALVKIDVDGIEHLILRGAAKTLAAPQCRSVLIEVNDGFREQAAEVGAIMRGAGFVEEAAGSGASLPGQTRNQIWIRP